MSYFIFLGIFPVYQLSPVETVFVTFLMSSLLRKCNNCENYSRKVVFWTQDPSWDAKPGMPNVRLKTKPLAPQNIPVGSKIPFIFYFTRNSSNFSDACTSLHYDWPICVGHKTTIIFQYGQGLVIKL